MTDLTSLGFPQGYHLGISFILWSITIVVIAILGVNLYLNARKSDLINVKELLRAKSFLYICVSFQISLIQVGVFYPDNFILFYIFGFIPFYFSSTFYFYYWEKNLTSIKRIPTISVGVSTIVAIIAFIISILFLDSADFLVDFLLFIGLSLISVAFLLYIYLIFVFSRNVKGVRTTVSRIWIVGITLGIIGVFFEYPPGVKIFPPFIVFYIAPIFYILAYSMAVYGVITLFGQISSYYAQTQKCAVHRGTIEKGITMHYCPSCGIVYCETCFNKVIKKDGCWNCRQGAELEIEKKEWIVEQVLELKKADEPKNNSIKKGKQ